MSRKTNRTPPMSRFDRETERRRAEMIGTFAARQPLRVTHRFLRLFKRSQRKLLLSPSSWGARCAI